MSEIESKEIVQYENMSALDGNTAEFKEQLKIRKANRKILITWLRKAMIENVDFGRIHVVKKSKCPLGQDCTNIKHYSKPTLFKPGAEKILGYLGFIPKYPNLEKYEEAAYSGVKIENIIIKCYIYDGHGNVVGEGVGARQLSQDYGDLNKAMKMCKKSAMIDATISVGGLSEVYTQDLEDMNFDNGNGEDDKPDVIIDGEFIEFGKYGIDGDKSAADHIKTGTPWIKLNHGYLKWLYSKSYKENVKIRAKSTLIQLGYTFYLDGESNEIISDNPQETTINDDPLTDDTKKEIEKLIQDPKITGITGEKTKIWIKSKGASEQVGKTTILSLEKMIGTPVEQNTIELVVDDLIETAMEAWKVSRLKAIPCLNGRVQSRFGNSVIIIDKLNSEQIGKWIKDITSGMEKFSD